MPSITRFLVLILLTLIPSALRSAEERILWTTSGIHGSPEPPPPFRVERAFPKLTFDQPLEAATIPGTNRLVVVEHAAHLLSFPNDEDTEKTDLFADLAQFDPEINQCYSIIFHPQFAENRFAYVFVVLDG